MPVLFLLATIVTFHPALQDGNFLTKNQDLTSPGFFRKGETYAIHFCGVVFGVTTFDDGPPALPKAPKVGLLSSFSASTGLMMVCL